MARVSRKRGTEKAKGFKEAGIYHTGIYLRLSVEDNGGGFPQEVLDNFNGELPEGELPPKEHLGLTNIRYTLRYSYHRQASLRLLNTETGAKAVIWIPSGEGAKEEK